MKLKQLLVANFYVKSCYQLMLINRIDHAKIYIYIPRAQIHNQTDKPKHTQENTQTHIQTEIS